MRPGPDVQALAGPVGVGLRVSSTLAGRYIALDIPVSQARLSETADRMVPGLLEITVPDRGWYPDSPGAALANYGQRLRVESLLTGAWGDATVDLGWWQIEEADEVDNGVSVRALSLEQVMDADPVEWASSPMVGARVQDEMQRLAGDLPVVVHGPNRGVSRLSQWGTSRSQNVADLAAAHGLVTRMEADGALHAYPETGLRVETHYTGRDLLLESHRKTGPRRANRWLVLGGNDQEGQASQSRWVGRAEVLAGPRSTGTYGRVTERREFQAAATPGAVQAAADTYRLKAERARAVRSVEIIMDPRVQLHDRITVDTGTEVLLGSVKAIDVDLTDPGARMRVDIEVEVGA